MREIIAVELPLCNEIYRLCLNEQSIKTHENIIRNLCRINEHFSIDEFYIGFHIIRTVKYTLRYSIPSYELIGIAINRKNIHEINIIDNSNNIYNLKNIIDKMDILGINKIKLPYFENMEIKLDEKSIISDIKHNDCELNFTYS